MVRSSSDPAKRKTILYYAFLSLLTTVLFIAFLIKMKPSPPRKEEVTLIPKVEVITLTQQPQTIFVKTYGTVRADRTVLFSAPFAGTVQAQGKPHIGLNLYANQPLFHIDTTKLDLAIRDLEVELDELILNQRHFREEKTLLKERIQTAEELHQLSKQSLVQLRANLEIAEQLFTKSDQLHVQGTVSNAEYLRAETTFRNAELAYLDALKAVQMTKDGFNQLQQTLNSTQLQLDDITLKRKQTQNRITDLQNDRAKADISVNFPSSIMELLVNTEQEVTAGTPLARVRSTDKVELSVNIPDSYFHWLYRSTLLKQPLNDSRRYTELNIKLVNHEFPKVFSDGYIKSVGESVQDPTRSLPVIVGRDNPTDHEGMVDPLEEMKPGMYCEVAIPLAEISDALLIPRSALQQNNTLYHVVKSSLTKQGILKIIEDIEVVYESDDGVIVTLPIHYGTIAVVKHPLKPAQEDMIVSLSK